MDRLPPLNPLRAFEAAAKLRSIRGAAELLSVTPGAVSRQVQILESHLGVKLFRREPRAVALTAEGEQYLEAIAHHLDGIRDATRKLTGERSGNVLKIRAYTTFAMKWLVPRLSSYQAMNRLNEVRLTTSLEEVDFRNEDVDCAVRLGDGNWPGLGVDRLVANHLIPVCSPKYRREFELKQKGDLRRVPLLHSLARPDDWMLWLKAAQLTEIAPYAGPKFTSSVLAYQAALDSQGVAIAQRVLVADDLRARRLVQPFGPTLDREGFTYYLIYPQKSLRKPAFRQFRSWLVEQTQAEDEPPASPAGRKLRKAMA
ncbi:MULTISPECIES: transcriptional regulator GcvA [unclassified Bradyrhizobium]